MFNILKSILRDLEHLVYPNNCILCQSNLLRNEECICSLCQLDLPYTNDHLITNNMVEKKLWGRVKIEKATSILFYQKGLNTQLLISNLKYKKRQDIGTVLGKYFAQKLIEDKSSIANCDYIIPMPLHPKKLKKRGYNQCTMFANALATGIKKPLMLNEVYRQVNTISQTGKNRINRWENVANIFKLKNPKKFENKHVLLIDDVVTTGATIEALSVPFLKVDGLKISAVFMANAI